MDRSRKHHNIFFFSQETKKEKGYNERWKAEERIPFSGTNIFSTRSRFVTQLDVNVTWEFPFRNWGGETRGPSFGCEVSHPKLTPSRSTSTFLSLEHEEWGKKKKRWGPSFQWFGDRSQSMLHSQQFPPLQRHKSVIFSVGKRGLENTWVVIRFFLFFLANFTDARKASRVLVIS